MRPRAALLRGPGRPRTARARAAAGFLVLAMLASAFPGPVVPPAAAGLVEVVCGGLASDVLFLFDTTGSMGGVIAEAQAAAQQILEGIRENISSAQFGVANYRDYPGYYSYPGYASNFGEPGDWPWQLNADVGSTDADIRSAVNGLYAGGGWDWPESLSRALYESLHAVGWRDGVGRVVVLFADAPPHDAGFAGYNYGQDPGRDAVAGTSDDLDFEAVVAELAANDMKVVVIDSGGGWSYEWYTYLAAQTGGAYEQLRSGTLRDTVVRTVSNLFSCTGAYDASGFGVTAVLEDGVVQQYPRADLDTPPRGLTFAQIHLPGGGRVAGGLFEFDGALEFPDATLMGGFARATTTLGLVEVPGVLRAEGLSVHAESLVDSLGAESFSEVRWSRLVVGEEVVELEAGHFSEPREVRVPNVAKVRIHEVLDTGDGIDDANLTATALHVIFLDPRSPVKELLIGSASALVGRDVRPPVDPGTPAQVDAERFAAAGKCAFAAERAAPPRKPAQPLRILGDAQLLAHGVLDARGSVVIADLDIEVPPGQQGIHLEGTTLPAVVSNVRLHWPGQGVPAPPAPGATDLTAGTAYARFDQVSGAVRARTDPVLGPLLASLPAPGSAGGSYPWAGIVAVGAAAVLVEGSRFEGMDVGVATYGVQVLDVGCSTFLGQSTGAVRVAGSPTTVPPSPVAVAVHGNRIAGSPGGYGTGLHLSYPAAGAAVALVENDVGPLGGSGLLFQGESWTGSLAVEGNRFHGIAYDALDIFAPLDAAAVVVQGNLLERSGGSLLDLWGSTSSTVVEVSGNAVLDNEWGLLDLLAPNVGLTLKATGNVVVGAAEPIVSLWSYPAAEASSLAFGGNVFLASEGAGIDVWGDVVGSTMAVAGNVASRLGWTFLQFRDGLHGSNVTVEGNVVGDGVQSGGFWWGAIVDSVVAIEGNWVSAMGTGMADGDDEGYYGEAAAASEPREWCASGPSGPDPTAYACLAPTGFTLRGDLVGSQVVVAGNRLASNRHGGLVLQGAVLGSDLRVVGNALTDNRHVGLALLGRFDSAKGSGWLLAQDGAITAAANVIAGNGLGDDNGTQPWLPDPDTQGGGADLAGAVRNATVEFRENLVSENVLFGVRVKWDFNGTVRKNLVLATQGSGILSGGDPCTSPCTGVSEATPLVRDNTLQDNVEYGVRAASARIEGLVIGNPSPASYDRFGFSIAAAGPYLLAGAPYADAGTCCDVGRAYLFDPTTGALVANLSNPSPGYADYFGYSVAAAGDLLVVGAPYDDPSGYYDAGSVYVFAPNGSLLLTIPNPAPGHYDNFGFSVAGVGNDKILVGAPYDDPGGVYDAGSAYLFDAATGALLLTLGRPSPAYYDNFGWSVAAVGTDIVVGAPGVESGAYYSDHGAAYLFDGLTGTLDLYLPIPSIGYYGDRLGESVAGIVLPDGSRRLAVGAPQWGYYNGGAVWLFDPEAGSSPVAALYSPYYYYEYFGQSLAFLGDQLLVGAPYDDTGAYDTGAVFAYLLADGSPAGKFQAPVRNSYQHFGYSVAGSSVGTTRVFAGVPDTSVPVYQAGAVAVLSRVPFDAKLNYWGSADGPAPQGAGDRVSSDVLFDPWNPTPLTTITGGVPS